VVYCSVPLAFPLALSMSEVNGPGPQVAEPQIAMFCGRQLLHMNPQTGQWEPDPQGRKDCFKDPNEMLSYCQEMFKLVSVTGIPLSTLVNPDLDSSRRKWRDDSHSEIFVYFHIGAEGEYVSEALLVPDRCRFLHQEKMDACESYVYWHNIAKEACTVDNLELHSYGMLLPCGENFRGVEYVCCPGRSSTSSKPEIEERELLTGHQTTLNRGILNSASKVIEPTPSPSPDPDIYETDMEDDDDEMVEDDEDEEEEEEDEVDEDPVEEEDEEEPIAVRNPEKYEYPIDSGPYQTADYLDSSYYDKSYKATTSPPLMKGESVTTTRPTDGVDVYFEKPVDDTEHANFLRAKTDLEERRMKSINEIMKEWAEADNKSKNLPKSEQQALNEHFQSVLQTLEEQVAGERQRLVETHLARVESILNNNRRLALENYLTAVQSDEPQPEHVLQALKRYMAAEQKDRRHTLRHYQHIVAVDPQKAEQMKFQVYTHLHVIEERMNQSLALLYKDPILAEELHDDIQDLVRAERGDISELMTTSFSETHTTEELLPAQSEEEKDDEEEEEREFQNRPYPPRDEYDYATSERAPTYEYEEKVAFFVCVDKHGHHFASFFPKQPDALETFNRGAMVGLLVVAVAIAMVMVISLLLVRRKPYGTISHGIVEVDPMLTPEERQLTKMQNHGYENPTYKFFEQMN
uniref:Amyloid beta like protein 1 n=1 Tax=Hippocampus comes TaxID=109280 RepID=A0A3Q2Z4Q8_HIPCM